MEGTAASAQINLITGMHVQSDDGWIIPATNLPVISGSGVVVIRQTLTTGFLRYLRWDFTGGAPWNASLGGATAITFFIRGMARRYA